MGVRGRRPLRRHPCTPRPGTVARPGCRRRSRPRALLRPGPAGPQVRLPGLADRGVRPLRDPGAVRQGPARRYPRGRAADPVPGHVRRVREGATGRALPAREDLASEDRLGQRPVRRPVRLPLPAQEPADGGRLRDRRARGRRRGRTVSPLHRRGRLNRRADPLAHRLGHRDPHRQDAVGPLRGLGDAAQPRLRGPGRVRQDHGRARERRAQPPRPA